MSAPQVSPSPSAEEGYERLGSLISSTKSNAADAAAVAEKVKGGKQSPTSKKKKKNEGAPEEKSADKNTIGEVFTPGPSSSSYLLDFISTFRSFTELSPTGRQLRKRAFANVDGNGNGICSLSELEGFVQNELVNSKKNGMTLFKAYRPSYIRAFVALTSIQKEKHDKKAPQDQVLEGTVNATKEDYVTYAQFRLWNIFLCIYAAMYDAFAVVDGEGEGRTKDDDMRIELREWMSCYNRIQQHGFLALKNVTNDEEAKNVFEEIDVDDGGMVLLIEWCKYLADAEIKADSAMGRLLSGDVQLKVTELSESTKLKKKAAKELRKKEAKAKKKKEGIFTSSVQRDHMVPVAGNAYTPGFTSSQDLLEFIHVFRPYTEKNTDGYKLRRDGFSIADNNGNGVCSLAELEGYIRTMLYSKYPKKGKGKHLFDAFRPCYIRAFQNAKNVTVQVDEDDQVINDTLSKDSDATYDDFVSFDEFRIFNAYLCIYAGMFDAFATIDGRGIGRDENDDKRIELSEWMDARGNVEYHGFAALQGVGNLDDDVAERCFEEMDDNGGGLVLLSEWCEYLKKKEVEKGTPLGELLTVQFKKKAKKRPVNRRDSNEMGGTHPNEFSKMSAKAVRSSKLDAPTVVSEAYKPGPSSSRDLLDFVRIFAPYCEKSNDGLKLRKKGYSVADINGNGQCSLAELENFINSTLLASFVGNVRGKNLFATFRPSYIKAYNAAKNIKSNDGTVLEGTKTATEDDYVAPEEFRVFNAYLCIYAGMFDAFARVDGMGEGRDENDDMRIELDELVGCYEEVKDYGFIGLANISNEEEAKAVFQAMDDNGGGKVLLGEWCEFIKKAEVEAKTKMGKLLSGDLTPTTVAKTPETKKSKKPATKSPKSPKSPPKKKRIPPKSLKIAGAFVPGDSSSEDLCDFIHVFCPLAEKNHKAIELRKSAFSLADTNGNGHCSLAEIDSYVKAMLIKECPQGKGLKLFFTFRPSYIRAFQDAKNIGQETKKIQGDANATEDDYISFVEFRVLNAFLCIYAAMYDTFARIDGEGEGRDENDDMRVELSEWMNCYSKVRDRGFAGLKKVKSEEQAKDAFKKMDADGGGMVLLKEWCEFLKKEEIVHKTPLGKFFKSLQRK